MAPAGAAPPATARNPTTVWCVLHRKETIMSFTQLDPPMPVHVLEKGKGLAFGLIDYGPPILDKGDTRRDLKIA